MNRFQTFSSIVSFSLFLAHSVIAAEVLSTDELRDLQQKMKSANQLSVDFTQEKTNSIRPNSKPSRTSGKASFAKPTKFRWELAKTILIFDGSNLYQLTPVDKSAIRFKTSGEKSMEIREVIDMVLDFDNLLSRYKMMESSKDGQKVKMRLAPKKPSNIAELGIILDGATATVQTITMTFANKNRSEFHFSNPDRRAIDPSSFTVPKEYKVSDGL